jgi:hypothetical protein
MSKKPVTTQNNISRPRGTGRLFAGALAGIGAAAGIIALRRDAIQKREKYNTIKMENGTLDDQKQQYYTTISIGTYKRNPGELLNALLKVAKISTDSGYRLPLPLKLMDKNTVKWEAENLVKSESAMQKIMEKNLPATSQIANVPAALQALSGLAPNEFLTMLFKGPSYKKFNLQFLISPRTKEQSMAFRKMVVSFKNAMAPSLTAENLLFTYPNVFQIKFNKATGSDFLYQFKPAVLESFTVDYAPANVPSFYVGTDEPESFVLSMDFCEIEFWLEGDFK